MTNDFIITFAKEHLVVSSNYGNLIRHLESPSTFTAAQIIELEDVAKFIIDKRAAMQLSYENPVYSAMDLPKADRTFDPTVAEFNGVSPEERDLTAGVRPESAQWSAIRELRRKPALKQWLRWQSWYVNVYNEETETPYQLTFNRTIIEALKMMAEFIEAPFGNRVDVLDACVKQLWAKLGDMPGPPYVIPPPPPSLPPSSASSSSSAAAAPPSSTSGGADGSLAPPEEEEDDEDDEDDDDEDSRW